jgi:8-oxo-dGTP pyrophosphatase MutT (NUDIX family)
LADVLETTWDGVPISKEPPHGTAVVVFQRVQNEYLYLVLHRKHCGADFAGDWAWGHPAGCRLPGESVERCAIRELQEETGLVLPFTLTTEGNEDWYVYYAEAPLGSAVLLSDEHDRFAWLPARAAAAVCLPPLIGRQIYSIALQIGDPGVRQRG